MSNMLLDQIKQQLLAELKGIYKQSRNKLPEKQFNEFEAWFWKIRPLLEIELPSKYENIYAETSGPSKPEPEFTPDTIAEKVR